MAWMVDEVDARGGAISFRDFMELALYDQHRGYYSSDRPRYGRPGDFLTAPSASRWYGDVVARLVGRLAARVGVPTLVDVGSGDGAFVERVVSSVGEDVLQGVLSIERSPAMRACQERKTPGLGTETQCVSEIGAVEPVDGPTVIHASELYDAMAVHRVVMGSDGLRELWVTSASTVWNCCRANWPR
jgi:SAM-dependent MidA family methyltransferase